MCVIMNASEWLGVCVRCVSVSVCESRAPDFCAQTFEKLFFRDMTCTLDKGDTHLQELP